MKEEAARKWNECLAVIRQTLDNDTAYATWFEPTVATSLRDNRLTLRLASGFVQELYEGEYLPILLHALRKVFGTNIAVDFMVPVVKGAKGGSVKLPAAGTALRTRGGSGRQAPPEAPPRPNPVREGMAQKRESEPSPQLIPGLNPALSFDNFCVGACNKLPWSIAESIARQPVNSSFNPFFLHGPVGVGKTHLMQAIGLHVRNAFPDKKVVFLPMKEFQRLYQNAYLRKEIPAFLQWFMNCDVLLFDDLQEITSSEGTLNNALFPIFSHLQMHGRQLVFTCDRPPGQLQGLEDRLIDRFKWGVVEKLDKPDNSLRKKILSFKAKKNGLQIPAEVIDFLADAPLNSVREIEGLVLNMMTRAINLGLEIDMDLARIVVANAVRPAPVNSVNFDMIVEQVAEHYRLNSDVIFSKSRLKDVAEARMVIMYLAKELLGLSTGAIGRKLARKHSTVIHGINTISERVAKDPEFSLPEIGK